MLGASYQYHPSQTIGPSATEAQQSRNTSAPPHSVPSPSSSSPPSQLGTSATQDPARPYTTIRQPSLGLIPAIKKYPWDFAYLGALICLFGGIVTGFTIYIIRRNSKGDYASRAAGFFGDALFILSMVMALFLLLRQVFYVSHLLYPRYMLAYSPSTNPNGSESRGGMPPWLLPRPPPYVEAVHGTGDIEDQAIAMSRDLPKYGDNQGSTLLLRSDSRGVAAAAAPTAGTEGPSNRRNVAWRDQEGGTSQSVSVGSSSDDGDKKDGKAESKTAS